MNKYRHKQIDAIIKRFESGLAPLFDEVKQVIERAEILRQHAGEPTDLEKGPTVRRRAKSP